MEGQGRLIDLRYFLRYLLHRWIPVLLIGVVFCAGMAGYSYHKQSTQPTGGSLSTVRSQNRTAYYQGNSVSLNTSASAPAGTYNSFVRLYVDFDLSAYENFESIDLEAVNSAFQKDIQTLAVSYDLMEEVIDELNLRDYDDMQNITGEDLRWMVNRGFEGTHILNIIVTDTDPVRAQEIVMMIAEKLMDRAGDYVAVRNIRLLDPATLEAERVSQAALNRRQLLKYAAVGFVGGIIVGAVIFLIVFLVRDVVMCRADVEYAGSRLFGNLSRRKKEKEYQAMAAYLELQEQIGSVAVVPVDGKCDANGLAEKIRGYLTETESSCTIRAAETILDHAEGIRTAVGCDAVLLAARKEKTSVEAIAETVKALESVHANILGTVLM